MIGVGVVGLGHWGPNLARNLAQVEGARLQALCDSRPERLAAVGRPYPQARQLQDYGELLADPEVQAVALATPAHTHYELASRALRAGKHVLVEKPLTTRAAEAEELVALAEREGRVLMVGHVFLYNGAVRRIKAMLDAGELGELYYVTSQRLNLGIVRQDVNALWNFAPHDLSILHYWLGAAPEAVDGRGFSFLQEGIEDLCFLTLRYPGGVGASVHISWLDPNKVRRMTIVGSKKMVVYDDVSPDAKLTIYDKGVERSPRPAASLGSYQTFGEFQLLVRAGDVTIPKLVTREPLRVECEDFIASIREGTRPVADGASGLAVVEALERAEAAMRAKA